MSLQATGLISGFDVNSIIDDLIKAESAPRQRLEERERILVAQQDELKTINSNLLLLQSRAASLADRTSTLQKIATSSDISILSATASTSAPRQTHQIEVTQLATASRNTSTVNISKPLELNRLAKLTLEGTSNTGSFYLDNYSSTNTVSLTTSTDLDDIISTNGATFVPSEDTYQNLSYKSTYRGEGADARLSVTKRISKRDTDADGNAVLTDKTKSLVVNPITFTDTDTNTTSTLGLSINPQTIFGTGDAYDANSKQLNLDASNQTHLLGGVRIVESQNSGTSQVDESGNVSASATSFDVDDGTKFTVGNTIVVDDEQMTVTDISTNTLTVTRGVNSTTAKDHNDDAYVYGDIVRVSTDSIGNIAKSDVLTFTGGGLGTSTVTGTVQGIVNIETGTFAISGDAASYDLAEGNITANSGAGSSANAFTSTALTPGSFTVDNSTYYVPKVLDSSLAVRQSNTNNIATTQKLSEVSSSITAGTVTINGTSVYVTPSTLLNGALNNSATTVTVDDSSVYSSGDTIIVDSEEMTITGVPNSTTLTVTRNANSTGAASHVDNSPTSLRVEDATVANLLSQLSTISGITASLTNGGRIQIKANAGVPLSVQDGTSNLASQLNFSQGITSGKSLSEFGVNAGTFTISDTATTTSVTIEITSSTSVATTLSSAITDTSTTSISVASASGLSSGETITVGSEQMTISGISGTTLTVSRGANSTTAATHTTGSSVSNISTTDTLSNVLQKINQAGFGITATLQPSGDIRLINADGTKTGLEVSDGTSNFASVFGFVGSGVTVQEVIDNVNATSTVTIGVQDVVKGTSTVHLGQSLSDDHALWINGQAFVMSTSADNGYTTTGELIDAINQNSDSIGVKASLTRLKDVAAGTTTASTYISGVGANSSTSTSASGFFQLTSQDGNGINTFVADTADVSAFTQSATGIDTISFGAATSVASSGQKVTFTGGSLGAEQVELEVQYDSNTTNANLTLRDNKVFSLKTDKDLTNAVLVRVTDADGVDLFPPTELTSAELTALNGNITATATSVAVDSASNLAVHDVVSIDEEQMLVTAISSNTLTVTRGYNNSTAATHANDASVGLAFGFDKMDATLGTIDKKKSKKQIFAEQKENNRLTLGGSSDTSDFFNAVGLNDLLVVAESHKLGFESDDTSLYNPTAEVRSSTDGLTTSMNLSDISSEIEAGTFKIDGNSVAVGTPSTTTLNTLISNISAVSNVTASLVDGQLQITTTGSTLVISDDLATSPGDDPDISTKLLKVLGIPTGTYTQGNFAGLTTNATLGEASINGTPLEVTLSTTVNDLIAKINSTDFSNMQADYNATTDKFRLQSELSTASRISLGATGDTSNILMALKLSETTQRSEIAGTQAKLVSFTDPLTSSIQNGDTFYLNNEKVTILDLNTTGIDVDDIVSAINELTSTTSVTAYDKDPDISNSSTDGKLHLKRTNGTRIDLQNGSLDVYSELRVKNSDLQVQDSSNNVISTPRSVIDSSGRLGGVDAYAKLSEGRFRSGSLPTAGTFKINSVTINYEDTDSLQDILDRISSSDAGVTASYNVLEDKIDMVSNSTGSPLIRLESNTVNQLTFGSVDMDATTDQIFVHRSKNVSTYQPTETATDYAFISDGTALSVYDTTKNTVATNTTGETIDAGSDYYQVSLQGAIKGVAIKDALLPDSKDFRDSDNFTVDFAPTTRYVVEPYSTAINASTTAGAGVTSITTNSVSSNDVWVGTYTFDDSSGTLKLKRNKDNNEVSPTNTSAASGVTTVNYEFTNGGKITVPYTTAAAGNLDGKTIRIEVLTKDDAAVDSANNIYAVDQVYDTGKDPQVTYTSDSTFGESSMYHMDDGTLRAPSNSNDFDLSSPTISMSLTAAPDAAANIDASTSAGSLTYALPDSGTQSNMLFTLSGSAGNFEGYQLNNQVTVYDGSRRFEGVIEGIYLADGTTSSSSNPSAATKIDIRPVASYDDGSAPNTDATVSYPDSVYFDGSDIQLLLGRDMVSGASGYNGQTFLDLTEGDDDDISGSSGNGITYNATSGDIDVVVYSPVSNLAGGNGRLNLSGPATLNLSSGWSASSNNITIEGQGNVNWGGSTVNITAVDNLSSGNATSGVASANTTTANLTFTNNFFRSSSDNDVIQLVLSQTSGSDSSTLSLTEGSGPGTFAYSSANTISVNVATSDTGFTSNIDGATLSSITYTNGMAIDTSSERSYLKVPLSTSGDLLQFKANDILTVQGSGSAFGSSASGTIQVSSVTTGGSGFLHLTNVAGNNLPNLTFGGNGTPYITGIKRTSSDSPTVSLTPKGDNKYLIYLQGAYEKYVDGDTLLLRQETSSGLKERLLEVENSNDASTDWLTVSVSSNDKTPDTGLETLVANASTPNGKLVAQEQGIAISSDDKMFVVDGTHQLRIYNLTASNTSTAPASFATVGLGNARFKNLFGVYKDVTNSFYYVYGLGKTSWMMGDVSESTTLSPDLTVLVAKINSSTGALVGSPAIAVDLSQSASGSGLTLTGSSGNARRITDGQVVTFRSESDDSSNTSLTAAESAASRLAEEDQAYLFLSYEEDETINSQEAQIKAYRIDDTPIATQYATSPDLDITLKNENGGTFNTIDSFGILELAGGEIQATVNADNKTRTYDLTQTSADGSAASDTASVVDNRPALFVASGGSVSINWRDNELEEAGTYGINGYTRIFTSNSTNAGGFHSTFLTDKTATAVSSTSSNQFRQIKGAGLMDVAFVADSQDSVIKVLDISKKDAAPVPQKNIRLTYNGNDADVVRDISVDHPYNYYSYASSVGTYQDSAYLYAVAHDGTNGYANGGLFRLNVTDPLVSGAVKSDGTSGDSFRLLASDGLNKDSAGAAVLSHVFASQGNVFIAGTSGSNSKVAFFANHTLLNEPLDSSETGIDVDDASIFVAGDKIIVDDEQMTINSISGNTLTVATRSTGVAHDDDAPVLLASALSASHLKYARVNGTEVSSKYTLGGTITDLFFDDSNNSSLSSGRYLYVGVNSTSVYRYDMETTANSKLGEVVEYDLSGLGISNVQNITVSHPSSTQTILYVTDSGDSEKVSAFDISTGTPTPVSMTTVSSADEVFIGRDNDGNQKVHFVDDSTLYTMSDLTATNAFMSALNMSEDSGTAGKDLIGRLNGVEFQRNQNETNNLLTGVTLNFKGTTGVGSPIGVSVEPDTDSVVDSVKTFVDQYNETETALREAVNARRIFNPRTEEELVQGVLANDTMLRSLMMRLSSISSLPVVGTGSVKRLADLGINRGRAGSVSIDQIRSGLELKLDESKLRSAISSNPEGAASIFGSISTLSTKAHRPIPKETETIVTVSSANYSLLETKIGRQVLIENSTSGTVIPMTLTSVNASGSQLTLASGTFSAADYGGYDLELVTNNTNPWHAIKINSTTVNATNNETVLKINDGGMVNPLKDLQNLNRVSNKLNSAVDVQIKTSLGSNLSNSETSSITLSDASKFADSGTIVVSEIDSSALQYEVITYTGKSGNTLTGLTRGVDISSSVTTSATAFTTSNSAKVSQTLFSVNVTDVDADGNFVTVGGYLDTDLVNTTNSKIVSVDGTVADITMTAIEQSAANQSILKVDPSLAREFSGGTKLRLKQGSQTNDLNVLSLDIDPISGFSSKAIPPAGDVSTGNTTQATPTSGKITTGGTSTTKMTVWADDLRSFIGRSRLMLSNGTTDEIAEIDSIDAKPRMLSNFIGTAGSPYTTLFTYTVAGSADRNGDITITADNVGLGSGSANLSTLGTNDHADRGKFEVHVGDIQHDVDTFGGNFSTSAGTYTVSTTSLASLINSVSGVSATTEGTNNNYIYIESDDDNTPINIVGKTNGIQLFSATNRDEDLIKFKGIAEVTLDTPANVPNLTGFNTIKAAYNDTMTVQGMLPTLTTGDLLVEGIAESTENVMAAYTKLSTGIIGNRLKNIQKQTRTVKEDMEIFDDKIVVKETKLLREFGALEAALGETQIQSQYLTAQLASLQSTAQAMASRKRK